MIDPKLKEQKIPVKSVSEVPKYIYNTNVDMIVSLLNASKNKNPVTDLSLLQILKDRCEYKEVSIDGYEFKGGQWVRKKHSTTASEVTVYLESKPLIARLYYLATCKDRDGISQFIYDFPKVDAANLYGEKALKEMIKLKNWRAIKYLIENGVYVDTKDDNDDTALLCAVKSQHLSMIKYLLDHDADVNERDHDGYNAIFLATIYSNLSIVKCLVEHGADVNIKNNDGENPLCKAIDNDNSTIVKCLVEHGADVNIKNKYENPLCKAIMNGNSTIVKFLLKHGADPYEEGYKEYNNCYYNAYKLSDMTGNNKIKELLNKVYD